MKKRQAVELLATIRKLSYRPQFNLKPKYSPFKSSGGTYLMKVAKVDAERILARARAEKITCAQVINSRVW